MTPRERVLAVLRGEPTDRVPFTVYECMIPRCAIERKLRNDGLCVVQRNHSGYETETPNCELERYECTEDGQKRIRTVIRTPVGEISTLAEPQGDREPFFTVWTRERFFKGPEDYKVLRCWVEDQVHRPAYEEFVHAEQWLGEDVILRAGVGSNPMHQIMIHWMGLETFAVEWAERRDEILNLESSMRKKLSELYPIMADSPITLANFGGNEVAEVMGRERFSQFVLPLLQECSEAFHAKGKLLGSHLDGNNRAWGDLVAQSGLDYVEAFTPAPDTDMTLADALEAWPDKVLWINFPSSLHLAAIDRIKQVTREIVKLARETNRVIIGITEDIPAHRWQGNLLAISEVINS